MDVLLTPLADIAKHYIQTTYLTFEDQKLNLLIYTFIGTFTAFIIKLLSNPKTAIDSVNWVIWFIKYRIFCRELLLVGWYCNKVYSPYAYDTKTWYKKDIEPNTLPYYSAALYKLYFTNVYDDDISTEHKNTLDYENCVKADFLHRYSGLFKCGYNRFCMLDGYEIGINVIQETDRRLFEICAPTMEILKKFTTMLKAQFPNDEKEITGLKVYECDTIIGSVKPELTFDNYVSRHKPMLVRRLDAFKRGKLYPDNPYMNNNLGLLVHGGYGTGKTYLASAVANYLERNIVCINFAKVKTKSEFRSIMSKNVEKTVFCFDEFDYLLTKLFESPDKEELKLKLTIMSTQLANCKTEEASKQMAADMKQLMDDGTSDVLTYEFLLSELSGLTSVQNRVIIATTNFIDRIPPALTRPGRIDTVLRFDTFNREETVELITKMFKLTQKEMKRLHTAKIKENCWTPSELILKRCELETFDRLLNYIRC
jgi:hypothetical protein